MKFHKFLFNVAIGIVLIVLGLWLSIDIVLKFAKAALGLLLVMIGISFLMRRW